MPWPPRRARFPEKGPPSEHQPILMREIVDKLTSMRKPQRQKVLVTGASGFTGGALAVELKRRGHEVRGLVRESSDTTTLSDHDIEICRGDLVNADEVDRAVAGVDLVYHIGAVYRAAKHPDSYYRAVNVDGTGHVLESAERHGVERVVHCSTVGVHGSVTQIPSDEDAPFAPGDIYQETKLEGEMLARSAFSNGLQGVIFRPTGIYGPGDLRFLKLFKAVYTRRFAMFGTGEVLYHFTYIDDLVHGIILCGEHDGAVGNTYILGAAEYTTLGELVKQIAIATGAPEPWLKLPVWPLMTVAGVCETVCAPLRIEPPLYRRRVEFFVKDRAFSSAKAIREIGFNPSVDLATGLTRTAAWYFKQGLLGSTCAA